MISYKQYKQLQESFGVNLGVSSTPSLGLVGALSKSSEEMLEEAKKKAKKMLAGSGEGPAIGSEDGEVVPAKAVKDEPVVGDEELGDEDSEELGDEEAPEGDEVQGDLEGEVDPKAPQFCKKGMKKKMKKESIEEEMSDTEKEFWISLRSQMAPAKNHGFTPVSEEILFNPSDPNFGLVAQDAYEPITTSTEPGPGEVGFAPQTVLGQPTGGLGSGQGQGFGGFGGYHEGVTPVKKK